MKTRLKTILTFVVIFLVLSPPYILAHHGPETIECRVSEEDFERMLDHKGEFKMNTTHQVETIDNPEKIKNLTVCDFSNGGSPNLQPYAHIENRELIKRTLELSNLSAYTILFELVKDDNHTLCETTKSEALRLVCLFAKYIPNIASALVPSVSMSVVDENTGSTMVDLRNNTMVSMWDKINILQEERKHENKSALLEYFGFNSSTTQTLEYNAQMSRENPDIGIITDTFFPYTSSVYSKHFVSKTSPAEESPPTRKKSNHGRESTWKKEDLLRYLQSEEFNDKIKSIRHPDNWRAIPKAIHIVTNVYNRIGSSLERTWNLATTQTKRIYRYYHAAYQHYSDVFDTFYKEVEKKNKQIEAKGGMRKLELDKLSFSEWYNLHMDLITTHDFKKTGEYHHILRGRNKEILKKSWKETGVMDWTSFADPDNKFRFTFSDLAYGVKCGFCWLFKRWVNCCNEGGCNRGFPRGVDPAQLGCSLPEFIPPVNFTILRPDLNPSNLGCEQDNYDKFTGYFQALMWVLFAQFVSGLAALHNGWIPWLDYFYDNIDGSLPSNIYWCMIAKARVGIVIVIIIGFITFSVLFLGMVAGIIHIYFIVRHQKYLDKVREETGKNAGVWIWDDENKKWYRDDSSEGTASTMEPPTGYGGEDFESETRSNIAFNINKRPDTQTDSPSPKMQVVYVRVEHDPMYSSEGIENTATKNPHVIVELLDETDHLLRLGYAFIFGSDGTHLHHE